MKRRSKSHTYRFISGDCINVLPSVPERFDLLLTDPPYAMPATFYEGRNAEQYRHWSDSSILSGWWRLVMAQVMPVMRPDAMFAVFANANAVACFWPIMFQLSSTLQLAVWDKGSFGMGSPLRMQTEFIIVGSFGKTYTTTKGQSNVFRFPRVSRQKREHLAQKPVGLVATLVDHLCPPGGRVLDPFAGSGSVEMACRQLSRSSVSIDWNGDSEKTIQHPMAFH